MIQIAVTSILDFEGRIVTEVFKSDVMEFEISILWINMSPFLGKTIKLCKKTYFWNL